MNVSKPRVMSLPVNRHGETAGRGAEDALCIEAPLEILINGEPFSVTMRSPGDELALVRGLLYTEGVLSAPEAFPYETTECHRGPWPRTLDLSVPVEQLSLEGHERRLVSASSCGLCGKTSLGSLEEAVPDLTEAEAGRPTIAPERVLSMQHAMRAEQLAFERSGGTHAAAAFSAAGEMLALAEDIGRHNAVDKVIGQLLLENRLEDAWAMTVSGRVSFEIVSKAARAQLSLLIAVSAPSSLSVELAHKSGMTLIGFCRQGRFNVYTHPERIEGVSVVE
jgi:FdhD protein